MTVTLTKRYTKRPEDRWLIAFKQNPLFDANNTHDPRDQDPSFIKTFFPIREWNLFSVPYLGYVRQVRGPISFIREYISDDILELNYIFNNNEDALTYYNMIDTDVNPARQVWQDWLRAVATEINGQPYHVTVSITNEEGETTELRSE